MLFVCDLCNCVDDTAYGYYPLYTQRIHFIDSIMNDKNLCKVCAPKYTEDLEETKYGIWHNRFPRKSWKDWNYVDVINKTTLDKWKVMLLL